MCLCNRRLKHTFYYTSTQHSRYFSHHALSDMYNFYQFQTVVNGMPTYSRQTYPHNSNPSKDTTFEAGLRSAQPQTQRIPIPLSRTLSTIGLNSSMYYPCLIHVLIKLNKNDQTFTLHR